MAQLDFPVIDFAEFERILHENEGDVLDLYVMLTIAFHPPRPDGQGEQKRFPFTVAILAKHDECQYIDDEGHPVIVLDSRRDVDQYFTYELFERTSTFKKAWCYRLAPKVWEGDDFDYPLADAWYRFRPIPEGVNKDDATVVY